VADGSPFGTVGLHVLRGGWNWRFQPNTAQRH